MATSPADEAAVLAEHVLKLSVPTALSALALLAIVSLCVVYTILSLRREKAKAEQAAQRANQALHEARARISQLGLDLMAVRNSLMHSPESVENGRRFKARWSDVFVTTYPKCGTTWMQQIVQALRSGGSLEFGEICEVMPWDIVAQDCAQSLDAEQPWFPRAFKSHESAETIAPGGRYIYVLRDPCDALVSFWRFLPGYMGLRPSDIKLEDFTDAIFAGVSKSGTIWNHLLGWWHRRHEPDVLFVFYEDLLEDLHGQVRRVADFLCVGKSGGGGSPAGPGLRGGGGSPSTGVLGVERETLVRIATKQSLHAFMSAPEHAHHFDDHFVRGRLAVRMRLPADSELDARASKVRQGGGRSGYGLPPAIQAKLDAEWVRIVEAATGIRCYAEMREIAHREAAMMNR